MADMLLIHGDFTVGPIFYICTFSFPVLFLSLIYPPPPSCIFVLLNLLFRSDGVRKKEREKDCADVSSNSILVLLNVLFSSDCVVTFFFTTPCKILITFYGYLSQGILTNETRCLRCETVTARDETFFDLSLDIEQNSSITSCLKNFSSTETLNAEDKFFCDKCCR